MKTCGSAAAGSGVTAGTAINIASVTVISVRVFIVVFFFITPAASQRLTRGANSLHTEKCAAHSKYLLSKVSFYLLKRAKEPVAETYGIALRNEDYAVEGIGDYEDGQVSAREVERADYFILYLAAEVLPYHHVGGEVGILSRIESAAFPFAEEEQNLLAACR